MHTQRLQRVGYVVEVDVDSANARCVARRVDVDGATPAWSYTLDVVPRVGNGARAEFDEAAGVVRLSVNSDGRTGHDSWEEAHAVVRLVDGVVVSVARNGG